MQLPTFFSRRLVAGVLFAAAPLGAATAALAQPAATGSPSGIALARAVNRAYLHVQVQSEVQHGFVWMSAVEGTTPSFHWAYGDGPRRGFYPATEHVLRALTGGRLLWWRDDLTPAPCTTPGICSREPVQIVEDSTGVFYAFGNAGKHTCYRRFPGSQTVPVGAPVWTVTGQFEAPVASGNAETLTSTFPWSQTQVATEVDTVANGSYRVLAARLTVSARPGAQAPPPFSVSTSIGYPSSVPSPPHVSLCG